MLRDFVPGELIAEGIAYTIMGMCVVFLILIIIMYVIKALALFSSPEEKQAGEAEAPAETAAPVAIEAAQADDTELVAVISAAVAASLGKSAASIRVRSYKKVGAWNRAGRREVLESRI